MNLLIHQNISVRISELASLTYIQYITSHNACGSVIRVIHLPHTVTVHFPPHICAQIRDPPAEGLFAYGLHLWGVEWEKNAALEITDTHPKQSLPSPLPVLHVTAVRTTLESSTAGKESNKGPFLFSAPCYVSTTSLGESPVLDVCFVSSDIPASRWPMRGVVCCLRPFWSVLHCKKYVCTYTSCVLNYTRYTINWNMIVIHCFSLLYIS